MLYIPRVLHLTDASLLLFPRRPVRVLCCILASVVRPDRVSNGGLTDRFKEALDEANATGVPWALSMTRRREEVMDKKEVRWIK